MKFDFIEIGTSDFETICHENDNLTGISIEPLDIYLNSLPQNDNLIRLNCAISNYKGEGVVYYVHPKDINMHNLPHWLKGCNSLNEKHPTVLNELKTKNLEYLLLEKKVEVLTWFDLLERYDISGVNFVKIDTEGHDLIIVNSILDAITDTKRILPLKILFESNCLVSKNELKKTIDRLLNYNYEIIFTNVDNTLVELKL